MNSRSAQISAYGQRYSKDDVLAYLTHGRAKGHARLAALSDADLLEEHPAWKGNSEAGALIYNTRHVQEHAAQLNLFLGQQGVEASPWVPAEGEVD
jgi:hypothetical protein